MYDVRLISISALGLKTFSVETKNVFYNDFWIPPPSLVQGHKLCREKVTMDTVCYEGGLGITKLIFQIPFLLKAIWSQDISYTPNKF